MNKKTRRVPVTARTYPAGPRWPTGCAMDAQFSERTKITEQKNKGVPVTPRIYSASLRWPTGYAMDAQFSEGKVFLF